MQTWIVLRWCSKIHTGIAQRLQLPLPVHSCWELCDASWKVSIRSRALQSSLDLHQLLGIRVFCQPLNPERGKQEAVLLLFRSLPA